MTEAGRVWSSAGRRWAVRKADCDFHVLDSTHGRWRMKEAELGSRYCRYITSTGKTTNHRSTISEDPSPSPPPPLSLSLAATHCAAAPHAGHTRVECASAIIASGHGWTQLPKGEALAFCACGVGGGDAHREVITRGHCAAQHPPRAQMRRRLCFIAARTRLCRRPGG